MASNDITEFVNYLQQNDFQLQNPPPSGSQGFSSNTMRINAGNRYSNPQEAWDLIRNQLGTYAGNWRGNVELTVNGKTHTYSFPAAQAGSSTS